MEIKTENNFDKDNDNEESSKIVNNFKNELEKIKQKLNKDFYKYSQKEKEKSKNNNINFHYMNTNKNEPNKNDNNYKELEEDIKLATENIDNIINKTELKEEKNTGTTTKTNSNTSIFTKIPSFEELKSKYGINLSNKPSCIKEITIETNINKFRKNKDLNSFRKIVITDKNENENNNLNKVKINIQNTDINKYDLDNKEEKNDVDSNKKNNINNINIESDLDDSNLNFNKKLKFGEISNIVNTDNNKKLKFGDISNIANNDMISNINDINDEEENINIKNEGNKFDYINLLNLQKDAEDEVKNIFNRRELLDLSSNSDDNKEEIEQDNNNINEENLLNNENKEKENENMNDIYKKEEEEENNIDDIKIDNQNKIDLNIFKNYAINLNKNINKEYNNNENNENNKNNINREDNNNENYKNNINKEDNIENCKNNINKEDNIENYKNNININNQENEKHFINVIQEQIDKNNIKEINQLNYKKDLNIEINKEKDDLNQIKELNYKKDLNIDINKEKDDLNQIKELNYKNNLIYEINREKENFHYLKEINNNKNINFEINKENEENNKYKNNINTYANNNINNKKEDRSCFITSQSPIKTDMNNNNSIIDTSMLNSKLDQQIKLINEKSENNRIAEEKNLLKIKEIENSLQLDKRLTHNNREIRKNAIKELCEMCTNFNSDEDDKEKAFECFNPWVKYCLEETNSYVIPESLNFFILFNTIFPNFLSSSMKDFFDNIERYVNFGITSINENCFKIIFMILQDKKLYNQSLNEIFKLLNSSYIKMVRFLNSLLISMMENNLISENNVKILFEKLINIYAKMGTKITEKKKIYSKLLTYIYNNIEDDFNEIKNNIKLSSNKEISSLFNKIKKSKKNYKYRLYPKNEFSNIETDSQVINNNNFNYN